MADRSGQQLDTYHLLRLLGSGMSTPNNHDKQNHRKHKKHKTQWKQTTQPTQVTHSLSANEGIRTSTR